MDPRGDGGGPPVTGAVRDLYAARFDEREASAKDAVWREIARYLQRYVDARRCSTSACDRGDFVRWVRAENVGHRHPRHAGGTARRRAVHPGRRARARAVVPDGYFGTVFMSNYLEHLEPATT